jgi:penicillin-binding protein 1A
VLLIAALLAVTLAVSGCVLYNSVSANLPDPSKPLRGTEQSTRITDRNGAVITELFTDQNRTNVTLKDIPPVMRNAIVATEDQRYYQHQGVDFLGMMRAAFADVLGGKAAQGGSTITQQYVKKAFLTPDKTIKRKIAEAVLAYRVEQTYSKDKILEMYLNTIYFGHGAYGISTAAETFFGKPVSALTAPEAALLAGVVKSPANYSPYLQPASAKRRRDTVLMQMRDQGYLKPAEYATAIATPIVVAPLKRGSKVAPYFVEYVRDQLVKQYGSDLVYRGGLKVTTTLDLGLQTAAENAVAKALSKPGDPSAAVVTTDPKTGGILVMVGGRDFASQQYNVVTQGHRQPGSAFKPFLLATALDQGVSPEQTYESGPMKIDVPGSGQWSVTGASGGGSGPVRLRLATWDSINSVFAQLIMQVGADKVATTAKAMGIATPITAVPAIALGGLKEGVTPLEMAVAYGTLANGGTKMEPFGVLEVRDASGKVLSTAKPAGTKAIDPAVAYLTTDMLKGVMTQGTGKSAQIGRPAAGKTGTTQEYRDAWFAGYTPDLTTVVWVGYPDAQKAMTSVHGIKVTGGSFPAQIWQTFMKDACAPFPKNDFQRPSGLVEETYCQDSGGKATQYCPRTATGLFLADKPPADCPLHKAPTTATVPNLIGMTKDAAIAALSKLALLFKVVDKDGAGATPGTVTGQDPKAGSVVPISSVVTITVATTPTKKGKPPVASFSSSPKAPTTKTAVTFDGSSSTDDVGITKYLWEFGDGQKDTASGKIASHVYAAAGTYHVILWVTDGDGQTSSTTGAVVVTQ